jgi:hypothetical protein
MLGRIIKKIIVREIAELVHDVRVELSKPGEDHADESVTSIVTEIGNRDDLLDGEIVAKIPFGFSSECRFRS